MSFLSATTRPRASLCAFREAGLSCHARLYAAKAKGGPVKQHSKCPASTVLLSTYIEASATGLVQPKDSREAKTRR